GRPGCLGPVLRDRGRGDSAGLGWRRRAERTGPERLAELARGRAELIAGGRLRLLERGELSGLEGGVRLAQLEVAEVAERDDVLRPQLAVLAPACDRLVGAALVLGPLRQRLAVLR